MAGAFVNLLPIFLIGFPIIILIVFLSWVISNKVKIKWKTFLKRGFMPDRSKFGVYVYDGAQGKGKTYSIVNYMLNNKDCEIYCNIKGIKGVDYTYFVGFKELIDIKHYIDSPEFEYKKQIIIVFDELFTELMRGSTLNKEVLDFLFQMRKRKIIFITTAQYWRQIPKDFRDFVRYEVQCKMIPFFTTGFVLKRFGDAENMIWDEQAQDFVCPVVETVFEHTQKHVADSYDTNLRISSVRTDDKGNIILSS